MALHQDGIAGKTARQRARKKTLANGSESIRSEEHGRVVIRETSASGRLVAKTFGYSSFARLSGAIRYALKPQAPVKTLADMTVEERAALERRYGAKISTAWLETK